MKLEPVIVVHGTFAQDNDWFRRHSVFCQTLDDQLKRSGSIAECWSCLAHGNDEFRWSGANSELERRFAGWRLFEVLATLERRSDVVGYHIISHSHGGNVVISAVGQGYFKKLRTVTFTETRTGTGYLLSLLFRLSLLFLLVAITTARASLDFFTLLLLGAFLCVSLALLRTSGQFCTGAVSDGMSKTRITSASRCIRNMTKPTQR